MKLFTIAVACSVILFAANVKADITIISSFIASEVYEPGSGFSYSTFNGTAIPTHTMLNAVSGGNQSSTAIDWDVIGGQTILSHGLDHQRSGVVDSYSASYHFPAMTFTANATEPYEFSGFYNVTDVGGPGSVFMEVDLYDLTISAGVFRNRQVSYGTLNEQFIVGGTGGDDSNYLVGSPTGVLIAGHSYSLEPRISMSAYLYADSGATASGNISLKIGTVPEPATLLPLGLGAICLLDYRKAKLHG